MSAREKNPMVRALPTTAVRAAASQMTREMAEQRKAKLESDFFGQQAGVPGMGDAPELWHEPAGSALSQVLHPAFQIFELEDRILPQQGWFLPTVNPGNPIEFEIASFNVPRGTDLWLLDYQFQVFRPSGVDPGDFVVAAPGRFSNQIGFDVTLSGGRRESNISFQLDPRPASQGRPSFEQPASGPGFVATSPDPFNAAAVGSFASTASPGKSLLPRRPNVQGPRGGPFTFIVGEDSSVTLSAVIFNTIRAPLAAVSGRMAGWLLHTQLSSALLARVRPR